MDLTTRPLSAGTRWLPSLHGALWRWLPKHPVPMRAVFRRCWLLTWRIEPGALQRQLPPGLSPWIHDGSAWLSIVVARMHDMRPTFLPRLLGVAFDQVVYRAVVTRGDERGVYFLRTEANHRAYAWGGDLLTHFHFHYAPIDIVGDGAEASIVAHPPGAAAFRVRFAAAAPEALLAPLPFDSLDGVRTVLCDLFYAFSVHPRTGAPGRVAVSRPEWPIRLVEPKDVHAPWMTEVLFPGACTLSHGVYTRDVPYRWTPMRRP